MKRTHLEKRLKAIAKQKGVALTSREGGNHSIFIINGTRIPVPRHREIDERLARQILSDAEEAQ